MKKILLLTDFSKRNKSAETTALSLCSRLHLDLLVMNNYFAIPMVPYSDGGPSTTAWSELNDQAQEEILAQVNVIKEEIASMPTGNYSPKIHSLITEGDIGLKVAEVIPREDIELLIIGAGKGSSFEHLIFGSVVRSVTKHASCPVLVVPENVFKKRTKKVVFATDFNEQDLNAFSYLAKLSELLGFSIEAVHVTKPAAKSAEEGQREEEFIKQLEDFSYLNIRYTHLIGDKVIEKINQLCESEGGDWLSLTDHPRSMLTAILHKNTIQKALAAQHLPILIFPKMMLSSRNFLKVISQSDGT